MHYDETPESFTAQLVHFASDFGANFVGGCCGTTPEHISAIAAAVAKHKPRRVPEVAHKLRLSGLDPFVHG